jgi:hypothetical protein
MGGDLAQKETKGIWRERRFGVFVAFVAFCGNPRLERCRTPGLSRAGRQGWIRLSSIRLSFRADIEGWRFTGDPGMTLPNNRRTE